MKPHKHAEVIKAWADGEAIESRFRNEEKWRDCAASGPGWWDQVDYRVKPKNIVVQRHLAYDVMFDLTSHDNKEQKRGNPNIEYVFSPEGKLISAKVL